MSVNWKVYCIFNQDRVTDARPLLKTLNALNIYQINMLQQRFFIVYSAVGLLLFMHKIKTNSSSRILVSNNESQIYNSVLRKPFQRAKETDKLCQILQREVLLCGTAFKVKKKKAYYHSSF